ncbi:MAG: hypothetical protein WEC75_11775 [Dehalococcoidia bacterium]
MTVELTLANPEVRQALVTRLARVEAVSKYDRPDESQASAIVYNLSELEESFTRFLAEILPALTTAAEEAKLLDLLHDAGEEFRHILFHIRDPKYYGYLAEL